MQGEFQDLRRFTVQILDQNHTRVGGTGVIITREGGVATCAHVLRNLGLDPYRYGVEAGIRRPTVGRMPDWQGVAYLLSPADPTYGDDIVVLQLLGSWSFNEADYAHLGKGRDSESEFSLYGFASLGRMSGGARTRGTILGHVGMPTDKPWRFEPLQIEAANAIAERWSGSPILDRAYNHVVGILFGRYGQADEGIPATFGWAVDAIELSADPLRVRLHDEPYITSYDPQIDESEEQAAAASAGTGAGKSSGRISSPPTWVGRDDIIQSLNRWWEDPEVRVVGIMGLGGEGKSALVARWAEQLEQQHRHESPARIFWWTFTTPDVEQFLEEAVAFVGSDPAEIRLPMRRAQRIVAAARSQRFVFVLDGLETTQYEEGNTYGQFASAELAYFLGLFAREGQGSLCLLTSRAPVFDLLQYKAYRWIDLERLSTPDGRRLLQNAGVRGPDRELDQLVEHLEGHALTLTLLGSYIATQFQGRIIDLDLIAERAVVGPHAQRVRIILERYNRHLTANERGIVSVLSAAREPLSRIHLDNLASDIENASTPSWPLAGVSAEGLAEAAVGLARYKIVQISGSGRETRYMIHPIIKDFYREQLAKDYERMRATHRALRRAYLAGQAEPAFPITLAQLGPFIQAVHHSCAAGDFEEAYQIYCAKIDQAAGGIGVLAYSLGAYQADLSLVLGFFPERDFTRAPILANPEDREYLLRSVALGLLTAGRLFEAIPISRRSRELAAELRDPLSESKALQLLAELRIHQGRFEEGAIRAQEASEAAQKAPMTTERLAEESCSMVYEAWCHHLQGDVNRAERLFARAIELETQRFGKPSQLTSLWGVYYAEHLRRTDRREQAVSAVRANMDAVGKDMPEVMSECHRVLGDIALDIEGVNSVSAEAHYGEALKIARTISQRATLIEALLGRGRLAAERGDLNHAHLDLFEALDSARECGYALYEADAHLNLALAYAKAGDLELSRSENSRAIGLCESINYRWGVHAAERIRDNPLPEG
jgi:tetratricopeptide (TPR) repeat protein